MKNNDKTTRNPYTNFKQLMQHISIKILSVFIRVHPWFFLYLKKTVEPSTQISQQFIPQEDKRADPGYG